MSSQNFGMYAYLEISSSQLRYKMRSHWIEDLTRRENRDTQRDTQRRRPCKDRGKDRSSTAINQRVPEIPGATRH